MLILRFGACLFPLALMVAGANAASGQDYPNKPIRIVTAAAGGANDFTARLIAQGISGPLGQAVIIDNRAGTFSVETVAKALPDGYTVLLYGSAIWLTTFLRDTVPWDPVRDFSPITMADRLPNILVLHPSVAANSVRELIALAKARPGELNYASGPAGATSHLAGELFKVMAGINVVRIPYKSGGAVVIATMGGEVQLSFPSAGAATPHLKSGRLRALAVTSAQPSALTPGLPTVAASGLPGYESVSTTGIFAPAKTPGAIINRLNQEIVRVLNQVETKERLLSNGAEAVPSSPEQLTAYIRSEIATTGKMIKTVGIRAD